jgi:hypothetical protein
VKRFALLLALSACSRPEPPREIADLAAPIYDDAFWQTWHDGRAELAGYALTFPRYGAPRDGTAVSIFVSEDFADGPRVKADDGKHPESEVFPVMKLNLVKDFQTGIYDYNTMLSSFVALAPRHSRPAGFATKMVFGAQEWCGQVYAQVAFDDHHVRATSHSYFDGEADKADTLDYPSTGIAADALFTWARGYAAPALGPGESRQVSLLRSLETVRLKHVPLVWERATLAHLPEKQTVDVRGTSYECDVMTAEIEGGDTTTFWVESSGEHRIVRWTTSAGEVGELVKSTREAYWKLHDNGHESYLSELGLSKRPPLTP